MVSQCLLRSGSVLWLAAFIATVTAHANPQVSSDVGQHPNFIIMLADDMGVETVSAYGGESYQTPHIDRMAREGLRFDEFHAQPLCTPSRVKLMTGKFNFRNYQAFMYLDPQETTFAHALGQMGYATLVAGKWQLIDNGYEAFEGASPAQAGFDEHILWQVRRATRGKRYWTPTLITNGQRRTYGERDFGPDLVADHVLQFIDQHQQQPFLIYYPMILPHDPFVTTPASRQADTDTQRHADMIAYTDRLVGRVMAHLRERNLSERTLLLFMGDNGTSRHMRSRRNGQWVPGGKGLTTRHGTHVPFIAWQPGRILPGQTRALANLNDVFPTLMALSGRSTGDLSFDGHSLVPIFDNPADQLRDSIFMHYNPRWYMPSARFAFDHRYKLYDRGDFFDMHADPMEQAPLRIGDQPPAVRERHSRLLQRLYAAGGPKVDGSAWRPRASQ